MTELLDEGEEPEKLSYFFVLLWVAISIVVEYIIMVIFPNTGLGGLFCIPEAILVGVFFGFLMVYIARQSIYIVPKIIFFVLFFFIQIVVLLYLHPQDGGDALRETIDFFATKLF